MMKTTSILLSILAFLVFWGSAVGQSQIYIEDFEDATVGYTTSVPEFNDGDGDFFTRTDGTGLGGYTVTNLQDTYFFAAMDLDGDSESSQQTLAFEDINISGYEYLELRVYLAEDDDGSNQDWDDPDFLHINYDIDNSGSFSKLLWIEGEGGTNVLPRLDTDFDGTGDGTEITSTFTQFTPSISGTGSTLDLLLIFNLDSGDEDIAIDNIEIWGTATGGTPTQLAITEINGGNSPSLGTPFDVVVQAQDGSGTASNVSTDVDVNIRLNTGNGSLGGTLTGTIPSGNNQTTISGVTYDTAEPGVILEAADNASILIPGTSSSFEVLEAASQLVFVDLPSNGLVASPLSDFTVEAQRSDNSVDLNYTKAITLSIESGPGTIGGTTTKSSVNGVATFSDISIDNIGDHNLQATDGTITSSPSSTISIIEVNIVLNEFLADPPAGSDPNGDGNSNASEDEFIEFVNTSNSNLDLTGWTIEDGIGLRHTFPSTVLEPSQAVVIFGCGTATSNFGGAIAQISSTGMLGLNNGDDSIILKDDSGTEIINHSYGSSEGNADQSYTRSPDITGNFTAHSSADPGNSLFSPGTRVDGFAFIPWIEINGNEGWRMFSTPTSGNTYNEFLGDIWTQCSDGAKYNGSSCSSGTSPNVVIYNGSDFNAVDNLDSNMIPGQGFLVFVYSDDDYTNSGADTGFPKEFQMSGTENSGAVSPVINVGAANTATLVGNPYLAPIDWDELTKNNLTETVYVYDDTYGTPSGGDDVAANGVAGSYRAWSSSGTGSLTNGLIAPFQGFWVLYDGSGSASLTIEESDKSVGGTFYKEQVEQPITFQLIAETERMFNEAFFSFNDEGILGMDKFDGLELTPLDHGDYLSLATETDDTLLDINNLPMDFSDPILLPLHINAYQAIDDGWKLMNGEVRLSWPEFRNIPSKWSISLKDKRIGKIINLKEAESYTFVQEGNVAKIKDKKPFHLFSFNPIQKEKSVGESRFILSIDPGTDVNIYNDLPDQFALEQNYPNPFNPATNIKYEIANPGQVELSVYNVMGQLITTLVYETQSPGAYQVTWDASDMASGIYHYRLQAGGMVFNRQMTLIK